MPTYAVILAGGVGARLGAGLPKQFVDLGGRPIIDYSLEAFCGSDLIDEVIVVLAPEYRGTVSGLVVDRGYKKVSALVDGGKTRFESTGAALDHVAGREGRILVHDAARPFLPQETIAGCVKALDDFDAVTTVVDSADTIVVLDDTHQHIESTLDRGRLRRLQTPQAFRLGILAQAFVLASDDEGFLATDDFTLVRRYLPDVSTTFIEGSAKTFKITEPEDLIIAEAFLADKN
ncbi:MAG: 2-C-methyl-D-erythritol 4-phosphate cytidylyltransferase [Aeromicrobium sp.]